jgi:hypothetical protein
MNTQPETKPQARSIHDIYTFYLSPAHLEEGMTYERTIDQAVIKAVYDDKANKEIEKPVIHFKDARRSLKCNKTQTEALWTITGTDDLTKWAGIRIALSKEKTKRGGKFTIKISKPEEKVGEAITKQ